MDKGCIFESRKERLSYPVPRVLLFAMFCFWQMGFIYFCGPALNIDGRTPLPMNADNLAALIAGAYIVSILFMIFLPRRVIWGERLLTLLSMGTALGLFLPISESALMLLIYAHVFFCCVMIGFETFVIVNFFSEQTAIYTLTAGYALALFLIALVQNDFSPVTFPIFRILTVFSLVCLLIFFFTMPAGKEACPEFINMDSKRIAPKKLMFGTYILVFVSALMAVSGPSISAAVKNGVTITYIADAAASLCMYIVYKKKNIHPFRLISNCLVLGGAGFLLMLGAQHSAFFAYIACALIGFGMMPCQMLPLYNLVIMKKYPSRFIVPATIILALAAVLVQSAMVEALRNHIALIDMSYAMMMGILVMVYLRIEPYFLHTVEQKKPEHGMVETEFAEKVWEEEKPALPDEQKTSDGRALLSRREKEVMDLIANGYTNQEIADILFISVYTVNDHTKKIYKKLDVHSRLEAVQKINKLTAEEQKLHI